MNMISPTSTESALSNESRLQGDTRKHFERPMVLPSSDIAVVQHMNFLQKYLEQLDVQNFMKKACIKLLLNHKLPKNPYPGFVKEFQCQMERLRLRNSMMLHKEIPLHMNVPTASISTDCLAGAEGSSGVWGLPDILCCISQENILQYNWLIEDITPPRCSFGKISPYSIQVLPALTGPSIFTGTFFPRPPSVDILQIYIVIGPDVERAISLYAHYIQRDILRMISQDKHLFVRLEFPTNSDGKRMFCSKLDIISGAVDFEDKTRAALLLKQPVEVQCLWQMGPMTREFRRGRKFYSLIVIQTSLELGKERVIDFSKQPLIHLFSSVFLQRSHIEVYLGIHVPLLGTVDGALLYIANASGKAKFEEKESIENNQPLSRSSTPQGANLTAIKTILKGKVDVSLPLAERMFQTIYLSVLLLLIDLKQTGILVQNRDSQLTILELHEELLQIYTFLHGITSQLFSILNALENIQMLQEASTAQALKTEVTQILLKELRELSENILNTDTANFSYDLVMLTSAFKSRLQRTATVLLELQGQEALTELRMTQCYGLVLAGQFLDGVLPWLPGLDGFMQECRPQVEISRNRGGDPEDKEMTSQDEESASGSNHIHPALDLLYYKDSYLDSGNRECAAPESGPGELVFLLSQYLLDCRLDQVWERCLKKILSTTPPSVNPYSILVTEFWKASLRLDLWHSPDENIMEQIFLSSPKMLNPYHPIMSVPGATGFGLKTALKAVNPSSLQGLLTKIALVDNYSYPTKAGSFKVALGLALHPLAAWYKSLNPFLLKLEVTEFCYLTGPDGCLTEALQIYAKIVHSHLCELAQNPQIVSWTIIIRGGGTWSSAEIQKYPTAFQEAFFESLQSRNSAVLKVFAAPTEQEWRCVPIVKNFVLYYLQTGKKNPLCFPKHDPTILYQCVFSSEQAADFHYKHVAPSGDPYCAANLQEVMSHLDSQIIQAFAEGNLLDSYRLLASRALICGQYECLPACWRMLHSISAQLEYLNSINTDIQEMFILNEGKEVEGQSDGFRNTPQSYDKMMEAFSVLLERTLTTQGCMICHSLQNIILRRIQMINAGRLRRSSIEILKEISTMCQAVSDVSAWHLHALCPEIQRLHQSVKAGASFLSRATVTSAGFESTRPPMLPYSRKNEKVPQTYPTVYQVLEDW